MSNKNPMSISEELSSFYAPDTETNKVITDEEARALATAQSHRAADEYAASRAASEAMNDHSGYMYGGDGRLHSTTQADTLVAVGGVTAEYETAVREGLISDYANLGIAKRQDIATADDTDGRTQSQPPADTALTAQVQYADTLVGAESVDKLLTGDSAAAVTLADKAGCTAEDVAELRQDMVNEYGGRVIDAIAKASGSTRKAARLFFNEKTGAESQMVAIVGMRKGDDTGAARLAERFVLARKAAKALKTRKGR